MYIKISKGDSLLITNFEAFPALEKVMAREEYKLRQRFFLGIAACAIYPLVLRYYSSVPLGISTYIITEIFVIIVAFLSYRANLVPVKTALSITAMAVNVTNEEIILKTAPLNTFIYNQQSNELRFNIHTVKISPGFYPLKKVYNPGGVFKLIDKDKQAFIIIHYFDGELNEKIREMYYRG
jgi:hypothetical protein